MIRTQIQLPDSLYRELKRVAREREMTLAEVIRRGAEYITAVYRPVGDAPEAWSLPKPMNVGTRDDLFDGPDWRLLANERPVRGMVMREKKAPRYRAGKKA